MRKGKLSPAELKSLIFDIIGKRRDEVSLSAGLGEDCAVLNLNGYILMTSDPITAKCANQGRLAIYVNANDIAASGGEPLAVVITLLAPVDADVKDIKSIMLEAEDAAKELNIEIAGGHSEFTDAVNRIVLSCTMIGKVIKPVASSTGKAGDSIVMTKYAAIEGTLILADLSDISETDREDYNYLYRSLSVLEEGKLASGMNISAMHDITEGGVFGAVFEMCEGQGAEITVKDIPMLKLTEKLVNKYNLNPYQLISSGSMLIATPEPDKLINALESHGIKASVIGKVNDTGRVIADYGDKKVEITAMPDEILKVTH